MIASNPIPSVFQLRLYVTGNTVRSNTAVKNLEAICATHLSGRCEVEVVDVLKQPALAREDQVLAIPTLVRRAPSPTKRVIGDLSNTQQVLKSLDIAAPGEVLP